MKSFHRVYPRDWASLVFAVFVSYAGMVLAHSTVEERPRPDRVESVDSLGAAEAVASWQVVPEVPPALP